MQTDAIITSTYIVLIVIQVILLAITLFQQMKSSNKAWLLWSIIMAIMATALQALSPDWVVSGVLTRDTLIWLALAGILVGLGVLIIQDVVRNNTLSVTRPIWLGIAAVWIVSFAVTASISEPAFTGWATWNDALSVTPSLIAVVGAAIHFIIIFGLAFHNFSSAPIPEVANRSAFWIVTLGLLFASFVVIASGMMVFALPGAIILTVSLFISSYGLRYYRLGDVRETILITARMISNIAIAWILIFATLYFLIISRLADFVDIRNDGLGTLFLASIAFIISALVIPARHIITIIFRRLMMPSRMNIAGATGQFTQRVARASTLEDVVNATTETLNHIMNVKRSALILINNTVRVKDSVELIVLEMGSSLSDPSGIGYLHEQSPIYHTLAVRRVPLGQYDIDYGSAYRDIAPQERQFFKDMNMSIFVPVSTDHRLIGLLACGTKANDSLYNRQDVELLSVIGQQVGTALRSARLIDDLQHLNDSMRALNKRLEVAKTELEKLDDIKTDFITIASHELRTPLAQIRGYTDIMDGLNEANALQQEQASKLVSNLRKSTERMEELISAMLDVSQIDVNSMDLRFIRTSPDTIIKMALEPLRDPAQERNITIIRHSSQDLPNIDADLQRMVQALRNIILNAIKFTPDGGTIEVSASHEVAQNQHGVDFILFKIQDSGVGIDPKDIKYIFNKFYRAFDTQLHSTGIYKFMGAGPGLGLTIAKGIIEGHGGQIWAESPKHDMEELPGSIFWARLPVEPPEGTRRVLPFEQDKNTTQVL